MLISWEEKFILMWSTFLNYTTLVDTYIIVKMMNVSQTDVLYVLEYKLLNKQAVLEV